MKKLVKILLALLIIGSPGILIFIVIFFITNGVSSRTNSNLDNGINSTYLTQAESTTSTDNIGMNSSNVVPSITPSPPVTSLNSTYYTVPTITNYVTPTPIHINNSPTPTNIYIPDQATIQKEINEVDTMINDLESQYQQYLTMTNNSLQQTIDSLQTSEQSTEQMIGCNSSYVSTSCQQMRASLQNSISEVKLSTTTNQTKLRSSIDSDETQLRMCLTEVETGNNCSNINQLLDKSNSINFN